MIYIVSQTTIGGGKYSGLLCRTHCGFHGRFGPTRWLFGKTPEKSVMITGFCLFFDEVIHGIRENRKGICQ